MPKLDDLFTANNVYVPKPNNLSSVRSVDLPRKSSSIPKTYVSPEGRTSYEGAKSSEGSEKRVTPTSGDPNINRDNCSGVLESVTKACNGNRYLEGIILGEILNTPRFRGNYRK